MLLNDIQHWIYNKSSCKCYLNLNFNNEIAKSEINYNHNKIEESVIGRQALSNFLMECYGRYFCKTFKGNSEIFENKEIQAL